MYNLPFIEKGGKILDIGNGDLGDANTSYSYFDLGKGGYRFFSLDYVLENTTLTIEVSNDSPDISDAAANWRDVTQLLTSSATLTSSGIHIQDTPLPVARMRIKRLTTNATNACELRLVRAV